MGGLGYGGNVGDAFAVIDKETMNWGRRTTSLATPPACWREVQKLDPTDLGRGHVAVGVLLSFAEKLPGPVRNRAVAPIRRVFEPQPAVVYQVDLANFWCAP